MKKLWQNCHIATMQNGQYSYIEDAAIVTEGHLIHWIGKQQQLPADTYSETVDLNGAWVTLGSSTVIRIAYLVVTVVLSLKSAYRA